MVCTKPEQRQYTYRALGVLDTVGHWIKPCAHKKVRKFKPLYGFVHIVHGTQHDFGIEIVCQAIDELRLNGRLSHECADVVIQLFVCRNDKSMTTCIILRPTGATEDLLHVQNAQIDKLPVFGIVDVRTLYAQTTRAAQYCTRLTRMITACAGKLTPHASVAVHTSTRMCPF
jgi:hypothetical protein